MALPSEVDARLSGLLDAERAKVEADERAAFDFASKENARQGRKLYDLHASKAAKLRSSSSPDPAKVQTLMQDIGFEVAIPSVILSEAERRSFLGMVREVGGGMAKDAGKLAADVGGSTMTALRVLPYLVAVALVVWLYQLARKATP